MVQWRRGRTGSWLAGIIRQHNMPVALVYVAVTLAQCTCCNAHSYEPNRLPAGAPWQGDLRIPALEGDFSLNAANVLSADLLLRRGGLSRLAPTHDLDARQLSGLARGLGARAGMLEAIVHQHLPIFHTGEGGRRRRRSWCQLGGL